MNSRHTVILSALLTTLVLGASLAQAQSTSPSPTTTPSATTSVILAWNSNPEPDIASYVLSYGAYPGTAMQTVSVPGITATLTLPPGQMYQASVQAVNTSGLTSAASTELIFQTMPVAPGAPTGLKRGPVTVTLQNSTDSKTWTDLASYDMGLSLTSDSFRLLITKN